MRIICSFVLCIFSISALAEDLCPEITGGWISWTEYGTSTYERVDPKYQDSLIKEPLILFYHESSEGAVSSRGRVDAEKDYKSSVSEGYPVNTPHAYSKEISIEIEKMARIKSEDYYAKACLADIYYHGIGIDFDLVKAYAWAYVVYIGNSPAGDQFLNTIERELTPEQKLQGQTLGTELVRNYTTAFDQTSMTLIK